MISFTETQRRDLSVLVENLILNHGREIATRNLNIYRATLNSILDMEDSPRYDHIVHRLRKVFPEMFDWTVDWNGKPYKISALEWPHKTKVNRHNNFKAVGKPEPKHRIAAAKVIATRQPKGLDKTLAQALKLWPEASIYLDEQGVIIINTNIRVD